MAAAPTLGPATRVTLGFALVIAGALWRLSNEFGAIRREQREAVVEISAQINDLAGRLDAVEMDRYTVTMAAENALRMAIANPDLAIPDPRDPSQLIRVERSTESP